MCVCVCVVRQLRVNILCTSQPQLAEHCVLKRKEKKSGC